MRWKFLAFAVLPVGLSAQQADFARCLASIRASPQGQRLASETWERYARVLQPDPRVIEQQQAQPEFTLPIWDYIVVMVDDERIADGRRLMIDHAETLDAIEQRYRVDPAVVVAILGMRVLLAYWNSERRSAHRTSPENSPSSRECFLRGRPIRQNGKGGEAIR